MRAALVALALSQAVAMLSQTPLCTDIPRILHGPASSLVFSYPSPGGFVRKKITRVGLDWLDIESSAHGSDRLGFKNNTLASHDAEQEDTIALPMLQLGGHCWPSQQLYNRHKNADIPYGHHFPPDLNVGHPSSGGLLVLHVWASNSQCFDDLPGVPPEAPNEWLRLSLCANMEERCEMLREFGGVFYESVLECPDVPEFLGEGIAQGKEYKQHLKRMLDRGYVDRCLDGL